METEKEEQLREVIQKHQEFERYSIETGLSLSERRRFLSETRMPKAGMTSKTPYRTCDGEFGKILREIKKSGLDVWLTQTDFYAYPWYDDPLVGRDSLVLKGYTIRIWHYFPNISNGQATQDTGRQMVDTGNIDRDYDRRGATDIINYICNLRLTVHKERNNGHDFVSRVFSFGNAKHPHLDEYIEELKQRDHRIMLSNRDR